MRREEELLETNGWFARDYADWTYEDIARGYRLDDVGEAVEAEFAESLPEDGYNPEK